MTELEKLQEQYDKMKALRDEINSGLETLRFAIAAHQAHSYQMYREATGDGLGFVKNISELVEHIQELTEMYGEPSVRRVNRFQFSIRFAFSRYQDRLIAFLLPDNQFVIVE